MWCYATKGFEFAIVEEPLFGCTEAEGEILVFKFYYEIYNKNSYLCLN